VFFCFEIVLKTGNLLVAPYSEYQNELHDTIKELHDGRIGYRKIALWLNDNGYQTKRRKRFSHSSVYAILKRKRQRNERLNREVEVEYKNFDLWFVERKLVNAI
jgi:hypothetical protein